MQQLQRPPHVALPAALIHVRPHAVRRSPAVGGPAAPLPQPLAPLAVVRVAAVLNVAALALPSQAGVRRLVSRGREGRGAESSSGSSEA
jgi:hypothetical protein